MRWNQSLRRGFATALVSGIVLLAPQIGLVTGASAEPIASTTLAAEVLTVQKGPAAAEVTLNWTGGASPWQVFRSTDPVTMIAPANLLGTTTTGSWTDAPPADETMVFYVVGSCGTPAAPAPRGCATCDICDAWGLSWAPIACADHYVVRWKCVFHPEQAWTVVGTSVGDICVDIGMCDLCVSGVEYIHVEACSGVGCSVAAGVPIFETPNICGGGCCVPR